VIQEHKSVKDVIFRDKSKKKETPIEVANAIPVNFFYAPIY
jgi:hypothetical protein